MPNNGFVITDNSIYDNLPYARCIRRPLPPTQQAPNLSEVMAAPEVDAPVLEEVVYREISRPERTGKTIIDTVKTALSFDSLVKTKQALEQRIKQLRLSKKKTSKRELPVFEDSSDNYVMVNVSPPPPLPPRISTEALPNKEIAELKKALEDSQEKLKSQTELMNQMTEKMDKTNAELLIKKQQIYTGLWNTINAGVKTQTYETTDEQVVALQEALKCAEENSRNQTELANQATEQLAKTNAELLKRQRRVREAYLSIIDAQEEADKYKDECKEAIKKKEEAELKCKKYQAECEKAKSFSKNGRVNRSPTRTTSPAKTVKDLQKCPVCVLEFKDEGLQIPRVLKCGHTLCEGCMHQIIDRGAIKCPYCRTTSNVGEFNPDMNLLPKNFALLQ